MNRTLVLNYVLYQTGWFACVLGAAYGAPYLGAAIGLFCISVHLILVQDRRSEWLPIVACGLTGLAFDSLQLAYGAFRFPSGQLVAGAPPLWMLVLWLQFGTTLNYCLGWLSRSYPLAALFGLLGGPLAFFAGEQLGAIVFLAPRGLHYLLLGLGWAAAVPGLAWLNESRESGVKSREIGD